MAVDEVDITRSTTRPLYQGPGHPRARPWEVYPLHHEPPPEVVRASHRHARMLEQNGGEPWTPTWVLLAEDKDE